MPRRTLALAILSALSVVAAASPDPNLEQDIAADQEWVTGPADLTAGHVDLGVRLVDGAFTLAVHDDAAKSDATASSVWRPVSDVVVLVPDAAIQTAPEDPAYAFLGAQAGTPVYVLPQTQNPDIVWLGWNTQEPDVMAAVDRGVTFSLADVQGPGQLSVFLQDGSLAGPELLWTTTDESTLGQAGAVWVDLNTHTHANWVFTSPGVYAVTLAIEATMLNGTTSTDQQTLWLAVGSETNSEQVRQAQAAQEVTSSPSATEASASESSSATQDSGDATPPNSSGLWLWGAVGALALLGAWAGLTAWRSRRAKRGNE